jgi:hypothetical protein
LLVSPPALLQEGAVTTVANNKDKLAASVRMLETVMMASFLAPDRSSVTHRLGGFSRQGRRRGRVRALTANVFTGRREECSGNGQRGIAVAAIEAKRDAVSSVQLSSAQLSSAQLSWSKCPNPQKTRAQASKSHCIGIVCPVPDGELATVTSTALRGKRVPAEPEVAPNQDMDVAHRRRRLRLPVDHRSLRACSPSRAGEKIMTRIGAFGTGVGSRGSTRSGAPTDTAVDEA